MIAPTAPRTILRGDGLHGAIWPDNNLRPTSLSMPGCIARILLLLGKRAVLVKHGRSPIRLLHVSQVVFSQLAAAVDSLCDVPGFGQLGGAVISRMGIVMIDFGSQTGKSYLGSFLVIPMTVSL